MNTAHAQSCAAAFAAEPPVNTGVDPSTGRSVRARQKRSAFWMSEEPVQVYFRESGVTRELSYSIDSELSRARTLSVIQRAPIVAAKFGTDLPRLSAARISQELGVSEARFRAFFLRSGVNKDLAAYTWMDLNANALNLRSIEVYPPALRELFETPETIPPADVYEFEVRGRQRLADLLSEALNEIGFGKFHAEVDGRDSEIKHRTFDVIPRDYRNSIEGIHSLAKDAATHFHLGIPADVGDAKFAIISRAIETLVTLDLAMTGSRTDPLNLYNGTSIQRMVYGDEVLGGEGERGVILFRRNEWPGTHNLEIRQHPTLERGFQYLEIASTLVQNHERLRLIGVRDIEWTPNQDKITVNLRGALRYASRALSSSSDPQTLKIARELEAFAAPMFTENRAPTLEEREAIAQYLRRNQVRQLLTAEAFLTSLQ